MRARRCAPMAPHSRNDPLGRTTGSRPASNLQGAQRPSAGKAALCLREHKTNGRGDGRLGRDGGVSAACVLLLLPSRRIGGQASARAGRCVPGCAGEREDSTETDCDGRKPCCPGVEVSEVRQAKLREEGYGGAGAGGKHPIASGLSTESTTKK